MIQTLRDALDARGYDTLTPVQEAVTADELAGADLLVSAQTGSGKTVGFGLAIGPTLLEEDGRLPRAGAPLALVIAPTRELAMQVMRELDWLYRAAGARLASAVGGMDIREERRALERGAHIVVATPGRLADYVRRDAIDLSDIRAVVLDEADEMLDLGFREDLEFILSACPEERRTLLFSATVPPAIAKLAEEFQRDARRVTVATAGGQHADIEYRALQVANGDEESAIINLLRLHDAANAIVFANTRAMVARLTARLSNRGFSVVSLSGELTQNERSHALQAMRDGRARICVATDVAARGIDLPALELVIHAELPSNAETLLHRSGRTGRAGRKGTSALIVSPKLRGKAQRLLKFAKLEAEWGVPPTAEEILAADEARLLADPVWEAEPSAEARAFAETLLATHGPEKIAAAYLALYRSRRSAPEELQDPAAKPQKRKPSEFGPGTWFRLSVGREQRAEPRWLLPLLCRAGDISKDAIGAIRIQQNESFVEIADAALPGFLAALGPDLSPEEGLQLTRLDAAPDLPRPERRERPERAPRPDRPDRPAKPHRGQGPKPARAESREAGAETRPAEAPERRPDPAPEAPKPAPKPAFDEAKKPRKPRAGKSFDKPYDKPRDKSRDKPFDKRRDGAVSERPGKPAGKGFGKPGGKPGGKPFGKPGDKPYGKSGDKPGGKPFGKPGDKPRGDKPFGKPGRGDKPAGPRGAADTSRRFTPPGKPAARGGETRPKRRG
ncbi:DEAD/DEAH box helicase [Limimaricola pyoseonensis]|uniref:ATP-dependent RNA helicase DeaD n=1 Tax=Limimaricola pyoseonensis TaxID=521013 RepID=A0A1G7IXM4_9RHOB|nr:DEAD/DEAH box helicase [Limimaricola pyoseonensis]SDF17346.1 ATP-dependent RNA helicase DeaD [Limimaricola pyoseonensis]